MSDRQFLDTNVLVYAYDSASPVKQDHARQIIRNGIAEENAVLSAQVLGEFFTVVTSRITVPLSAEEAEGVIDLLSALPVVEIDLRLVRRATGIHRLYGINYWDSLIVAAAQRAGCTQILTEDLNTGQSYQGIVAVNRVRPTHRIHEHVGIDEDHVPEAPAIFDSPSVLRCSSQSGSSRSDPLSSWDAKNCLTSSEEAKGLRRSFRLIRSSAAARSHPLRVIPSRWA